MRESGRWSEESGNSEITNVLTNIERLLRFSEVDLRQFEEEIEEYQVDKSETFL